jgi:hypothetical protein
VSPVEGSTAFDLAQLSNPHGMWLDDATLCRLREALLIIGLF